MRSYVQYIVIFAEIRDCNLRSLHGCGSCKILHDA